MISAAQLVEKNALPPVLPAIEKDETLYSWCATVNELSGNTNSEKTSRALFGYAHSHRQHDVPRNLGALHKLLCSFTGSFEELLRDHTVGACYLPFMSQAERDHLALVVEVGTNPHWRRLLLSPSRSQPIQHPLKFCNACRDADTLKIGRAYWHTCHQFPAAWTCILHGEPLQIFIGNPRRWLLPSPRLEKLLTLCDFDTHTAEIAASVGTAISMLETVNTDALRTSALMRLRDIGVIHSLAGARHEKLANWFANSEMGRMCKDPYSGMPSLSRGEWIPALLWRKKRDHPARWIALWSALQWDDRFQACASITDACTDSNTAENGQFLLFGPKEVRVSAPNNVYDVLKISDSYQEAMSHLKVSRGDLVRWLSADPELRQIWKKGIFDRRLKITLQRLTTALSEWVEKTTSLEGFVKNNSLDVRWLAEHSPRDHQFLLGNLFRKHSKQQVLF